jgi:hypothetical protein
LIVEEVVHCRLRQDGGGPKDIDPSRDRQPFPLRELCFPNKGTLRQGRVNNFNDFQETEHSTRESHSVEHTEQR